MQNNHVTGMPVKRFCIAVGLVFVIVAGSLWIDAVRRTNAAEERRKRSVAAGTIGSALKRFQKTHADQRPKSLKDLRFDDYGCDVDIRPFKFFPLGTHKGFLGQDVIAETDLPGQKDSVYRVGWDGEIRLEYTKPWH